VKKWTEYFQLMPPDIQQRIKAYRKTENKYQLLLGRLLLKQGMQEMGADEFHLKDIEYNDRNCPVWKGGIHFSISHSGRMVVCALSKEGRIGIDVEQVVPVELKNFGHVLNEFDKQKVRESARPYHTFFEIWTIKEALTKMLEKGLAIDVLPINILADYIIYRHQKFHFKRIETDPEFIVNIVSENNILNSLRVNKIINEF